MNLETLLHLSNRMSKEDGFMLKIKEYPPIELLNSHIKPLVDCARVSKKIVNTWYAKGYIEESEIKELEQFIDDIEEDKF